MGNLQEKPKRKRRLDAGQIVALSFLGGLALVVLIGALNNFGR
jgi:hypothetical protein